MKVIAQQAVSYAKKRYAPGETIEISERDAKLLAATGRVRIEADQAAPLPASVEPADPDAVPENVESGAESRVDERASVDRDSASRKKGRRSRYDRRDMRAVEEEHEADGSASLTPDADVNLGVNQRADQND